MFADQLQPESLQPAMGASIGRPEGLRSGKGDFGSPGPFIHIPHIAGEDNFGSRLHAVDVETENGNEKKKPKPPDEL